MENQKDPETLVQDLGQAQNPYDKTLELGSGLSGFNLGFNPVLSLEGLFGENDGWLVEEGGGMGVNNVEVSDQGMMNFREGIEVIAEGGVIYDLNCVDYSVEEGHQVNSNVEVVVEKPLNEEGTDKGNVSQLYEVNPASNKEASEDSNSLFVEVFGQSNGLVPGGEADFGGTLNDGMDGALMPETEEVPSSDLPEIQGPVIGLMQNGEREEAISDHEVVFAVPETEEVPSSDVPEIQDPVIGVTQNVEREEAISNHEVVFAVGDLIWVETKTPCWWPGLISDPSHAPEDATKADEKFDILVKCFGNDSYVWCSKSQLKPFFENFEQLSIQSNSKGFISSIEKAVDEFVRRVKLELSCSCNGGSAVMPENKVSGSGETFSTQFEPADFLGFVKDLALHVSVPDVFEYVVTQNRLSAFYRSVGHFQMPVRQLWETNYLNGTVEEPKAQTHHSVLYLRRKLLSPVTKKVKKLLVSPRTREKVAISGNNGGKVAISEDNGRNDKKVAISKNNARNREKVAISEINRRKRDKVAISENNGWSEEKSEKGYESRERRRSKYLSPPYVSLAPKDLPISEDNEAEVAETVSPVAQDTKSIDGRSMGSSSSLKSRGKKSSKKEDLGHKISISLAEIESASSLDMVSELRLAALNCLHRKRTSNFDLVDQFFCVFRRSVFRDEANPEIEFKATDEAKESTKPVSSMPVIAMPDTGQNAHHSDSVDKDTKESGQPLPTAKPKRHRRTKKELAALRAAAGSQNGPGFPDANSNPTNGAFIINFEEGCLVASNSESMPKKRKMNSGSEAPELLECNIEVALPDLNGNFITPSSLLPASEQTNAIIPEPKKRRRRRTKAEMAAAAAALANGSGNSAKSGSSGQDIAGVNGSAMGNNMEIISFSIDQQPINGEPKKRKRQEEGQADHLKTDVGSAIPDLNSTGEPQRKRRRRRTVKPVASGTSLILRFAPGFPVPSNDALVATFCGFGPLKESETQGLSDPGCAQVVFVNSSSAAEAFQSLEKCSPFGPALIGYNLHHIAAPPSASGSGQLHVPVTSPRVKTFKAPAKPNVSKPQPAESPDLSFVRKNLEKMTAMLEKAGDDLSPETRSKLEGEVKGLLKKVSSLVGSSSSSSS